jgi:hypothetical protein
MHQKTVAHLHLWMSGAMFVLTDRIIAPTHQDDDQDQDRGDVPGWVMITVMTAIVVIALLTVFRTEVTTAVKNAFDSVSGSGKA